MKRANGLSFHNVMALREKNVEIVTRVKQFSQLYKGLVHKIWDRARSLSQIQKWHQTERKSVCYRAMGDKPRKTRWY